MTLKLMRRLTAAVLALVLLPVAASAQNQDEQDALQAKADALWWQDFATGYYASSNGWMATVSEDRNAMAFAFNSHVRGVTIPEEAYDEAEQLLSDANLNLGWAALQLSNPSWSIDSASESIDNGNVHLDAGQDSFDVQQYYVAQISWQLASSNYESAAYDCQTAGSYLDNASTSISAMDALFVTYPPPP